MKNQKVRQGVYITGLLLESANRVASIIGRREPVKRSIVYNLYRLGRLLKR